MKYTIEILPDPFTDPQSSHANCTHWSSYIYDAHGEEIDGNGDIHTFEEAVQIALYTISRLTADAVAYSGDICNKYGSKVFPDMHGMCSLCGLHKASNI